MIAPVFDWGSVELWLTEHRCYERQRTGSCRCTGCAKVDRAIQAVGQISVGLPSKMSIEDIAALVYSKTCRKSRSNHGCNHKGCINAEALHGWLQEQMSVRKAA